MLQINPFLDCTYYSGIIVHIGRNNQLIKSNTNIATTINRYINQRFLNIEVYEN
jgi:hypothetical protein